MIVGFVIYVIQSTAEHYNWFGIDNLITKQIHECHSKMRKLFPKF